MLIKEIDKDMGSIMARLQLIYDDVQHLKGNKLLVKDDAEYIIIDTIGNELGRVPGGTYKKIDDYFIFERNDGRREARLVKITDSGKLDVVKKDITDYKILDRNIVALKQSFGDYAIYGKDLRMLAPPIYRDIRMDRDLVDGIQLSVTVDESIYTDQNGVFFRYSWGRSKYSKIRITGSGRNIDKYFSYQIGDQDIYEAVAVSYLLNGKGDPRFKYRISKNGELIGDEGLTYNSITTSNRSLDREIIEVWTQAEVPNLGGRNLDLNRYYKGLISTDGDTLIMPNKYSNIEETPFKDTFIVEQSEPNYKITAMRSKKIGIYKVGHGEVIPCGTLKSHMLTSLNITAFEHTQSGKMVYMGNDSSLYADINKAFPIYKMDTADGSLVFLINVYGINRVVDENLKEVGIEYEELLRKGVRPEHWIKV